MVALPKKTVCLVILKPSSMGGMRDLIKSKKTRGIPSPGSGVITKIVAADGMLCEVDEADLDWCREFCEVEVVDTKEVQ